MESKSPVRYGRGFLGNKKTPDGGGRGVGRQDITSIGGKSQGIVT
jgi:hypothetical protein